MRIRDLRGYLQKPKNGVPRIAIKIGGGCLNSRDKIEADPVRLKAIVDWIVHLYIDSNFQITLITSAPGGKTDHLIRELHKEDPDPSPSKFAASVCQGEADMAQQLAETINTALGPDINPATCYTANRMGLCAKNYNRTIIKLKRANSIIGKMTRKEKRSIPVCAGYQALNESGSIIDLGRGGSDASAVAIAIALNCDMVICLKDVDGMYVAPPNLVPDARRLEWTNFSMAHSMASTGSKVLMARAVEIAEEHQMPILVTLCPGFPGFDECHDGTIIKARDPFQQDIESKNTDRMLGLGASKDVTTFFITGIPDEPGVLAQIFSPLQHITIGEAAQSISRPSSQPTVSFTVGQSDADNVNDILREHCGQWDIGRHDDLAILSLIGSGLLHGSGYFAKITESLGNAGINIEMLGTSDHGISAVIKQDHLENAAKSLASTFNLLET